MGSGYSITVVLEKWLAAQRLTKMQATGRAGLRSAARVWVYDESWAKGPWKGFPLRKPFDMQLTVSAKVFFWNGERFFFLAKVLAKVHVHMSKYYVLMFHVVRLLGDFSRKFGESFAKALAKDGLPSKARWPKLWTCCVRTGRWRWARTNILKQNVNV